MQLIIRDLIYRSPLKIFFHIFLAFWYKYKLSKYQTNILSRYSDGVVPVCLRKKRVIVEFD